MAASVIDWSQIAAEIWRGSNIAGRREILESVCLNRTLTDATLVPTMRKLFDVLAEGLVSENSRGDKTAIELFLAGVRGWEAGLRRRLDDGKSK